MSRRHFILVHILTPMGQPGLWLSGERSEITAIALTHAESPLWNRHTDTYTPPQAVQHRNTLTGTLALTIEKDPSQWSFVLREKNKKTGYKKTHHSYSTWLVCGLPAQYTCYFSRYLMVSHADIRTHCVVNNTLLAVFALKRKMNFYTLWTRNKANERDIQH